MELAQIEAELTRAGMVAQLSDGIPGWIGDAPRIAGPLAENGWRAPTTIVMPAYTGVIWRANCLYHLGI